MLDHKRSISSGGRHLSPSLRLSLQQAVALRICSNEVRCQPTKEL